MTAMYPWETLNKLMTGRGIPDAFSRDTGSQFIPEPASPDAGAERAVRHWTAAAAPGEPKSSSAPSESDADRSDAAEELTVLVVEDNEGDFYLVRELINEINQVALYRRFVITHAKRLGEAIALCSKSDFDLVLLDLSLPDTEPAETLRTFRSSVPKGAVVVWSGLSDLDTAIRAVGEGAQDYLVKGATDSNLLLRSMLYAHERKVRREEEQQVQEQLGQNERLKSLGLFAGGIAHDFNNLLMAIMGNLELVGMRLGSQSMVVMPYLDRMTKALNLCAGLTKQLLAYGGSSAILFEKIDLNAVAKGMRELLRSATPKHIELVFDLAADLPKIEADVTQISQILLNLITNASDAIGSDRGTITVDTFYAASVAEDRSVTRVGSPRPGSHDFVVLKVADDGSGISQDMHQRIFEPFVSTKQKGRGLGLSAVWGIVHRMGGFLELDSAPGEGTRFSIFFPAVAEAPVREVMKPIPHISDTIERGTILVVDDERSVTGALIDLLKAQGFKTLPAYDGASALRIFSDRREEIQAVLLNMTLPDQDGLSVFEKIRAIRHDIPILFSSGINETKSMSLARESGGTGFLQKPYSSEEIVNALVPLLERKRDA